MAQVAGQPQPFINNLSDEADRNLRKFGDDTELGTVTDTSEGSAAVDQLGRVEKWMNGYQSPATGEEFQAAGQAGGLMESSSAEREL